MPSALAGVLAVHISWSFFFIAEVLVSINWKRGSATLLLWTTYDRMLPGSRQRYISSMPASFQLFSK